MKKIKKLDPIIIDRIAAGEVIERPSSVIKELVENSIDAKATKIEIFTYSGGIEKIIVKDNGEGISKEDLPLTIEKHATSKISTVEDIEKILSYGFRGEALSSIASVSHLEIQTKHIEEEYGNQMIVVGGKISKIAPFSSLQGTKIIVENLFFTTPVRKKFLKSTISEDRYIFKEITKLGLANPSIHFSYYRDDKFILNLDAITFEDLHLRIEEIFKKNISELLIPVYYEKDFIKIAGWVRKPRLENSFTDKQYIFINHRPVEIKNISYIIKTAYGDLLPDNSKPIFFLYYDIPPNQIDVNVHPTKKEIRFLDDSFFTKATIEAIRKALIPNTPLGLEKKEFLIKKSNSQSNHKSTGFLYPVEEILKSTTTTISYVKEETSQIKQDDIINPSFLPTKHFGVLFGTYILAANDNEFFIIDQHTAHERINYERKKEYLEKNPPSKQILLNPILIELNQEEKDLLEENSKSIQELGFSFDFVTKNTIAIREIPDFLEEFEREIFIKLFYKISKGIDFIQLYDDYIALKACKASFKKNDYIPQEVITQILIDLSKCKEPSRCPHGRPTMIKIKQSELEYLFYRKGF